MTRLPIKSHTTPVRAWFACCVVLACAVAAVAVAPAAFAEEPQESASAEDVYFPWAGEELYFSVRVNGVEAVRAGVRVGDVRLKDDRPYVPISAAAQSTGLFNSVYPINDKANTFLHPVTLKPLRSEKYFDEAGKMKNYKVDFVHSTYQAKVVRELPQKEKTRKFTKPIPGTTHDMMTWFYELRKRQDLRVGEKMSFYIYDGWKLSRLDAVVAKTEDVYTPMGWFKAYRIDFEREILRSHKKKGAAPILKVSKPATPTGSLWVSRDQNMLPIKVRIETKWGVGEALIIKFKPGRHMRD